MPIVDGKEMDMLADDELGCSLGIQAAPRCSGSGLSRDTCVIIGPITPRVFSTEHHSMGIHDAHPAQR